jgi:hypothetical protein
MKFKKGLTVARRLNVFGNSTISFEHTIVKCGKDKMTAMDPTGDHHVSEYRVDSGSALENYTCGFSYILTEEDAVKEIELGNAELDGGEEDYYFGLLNRLEEKGKLDDAIKEKKEEDACDYCDY